MPVRPDGFMTADVLIQELDLDPRILASILNQVHPATKRIGNSGLLYYSPDTIVQVEEVLAVHPEYRLSRGENTRRRSANEVIEHIPADEPYEDFDYG